MKTRMRVLSILVCLALLMSAAPADLRLAAGFATEAEGEIEAAVNEPAPIEEAEPEPGPEVIEESEGGDETAEPPADGAPAGEDEAGSEESSEEADSQAGDADAGADAATDEAPGADKDEANIDYAADAGASPAFVEGYAELVREGAILYVAETAEAEAKAELGRGVVYATARSDAQDDPDRLKVSFNAERGVDSGWVDASMLRPMKPEAEVPAYIEFCRDRENVIYSDELAGLPLARISCAYPEEEKDEPADDEKTEVGSNDADAGDVHPVIDLTPVAADDIAPDADAVEGEVVAEDSKTDEYDISTMPLPLDDALFRVEDVLAAIDQDSVELYEGESQQLDLELSGDVEPVLTSSDETVATVTEDGVVTAVAPGDALITMMAGDMIDMCSIMVMSADLTWNREKYELDLSVGQTFDLIGAGFITCTDSNNMSKDITFSLKDADGDIVDVTSSGVVTAKSVGEATILATVESWPMEITVRVHGAAKGVSIRDSLTLSAGMTADLGITFDPADAYSSYTLKAEPDGIVEFDEAQRKVKGLQAGTATVTITTADGQHTDTCFVKVLAEKATITADPVTMVYGEEGRRIEAVATSGGEEVSCVLHYELKADSQKAVNVDPDTGALEALEVGTATVTISAVDSGIESVDCEVTVVSEATGATLEPNAITLAVGEKFTISDDEKSGIIKLSSGGHIPSYTFRSSNTAYVTVDENGVIQALKAGSATVTISPSNNVPPMQLAVTVKKAATSISLDKNEILLQPVAQNTDDEKCSENVTVSFPSGTYANYSKRLVLVEGGEETDIEDAEEPHVTFSSTAADTYELKVDSTLAACETYRFIVETESGLVDSCTILAVPGPENIEVTSNKDTLGVGETGGKVTATIVADEDGSVTAKSKFTYESSDPDVLQVDKDTGVLTALAVSGGKEVTITAKATVPCGGVYASETTDAITVVSNPTSFKFNEGKDTLLLGVGDTYLLGLGSDAGETEAAAASDPDGIFAITPTDARASFTYRVASGSAYGTVSDDGLITALKVSSSTKPLMIEVSPVQPQSGVKPLTLTVNIKKAASSVTLSESALQLLEGTTRELSVTFPNGTANYFTVKSSDEGVVKVEKTDAIANGSHIKLTTVAKGEADIIVETSRGCVDSCRVQVFDALTGIEFKPNSIDMGVGEQGRSVKAVYKEEPGTLKAPISYVVPDAFAAYLKVDESTGALTALKATAEGSPVRVDAYREGDDKNLAAPASVPVRINPIPTSLDLYEKSATLYVNQTYQITASNIAPNEGASASYAFSTSNAKVASVDKATGLIRAVAAGTATITVQAQSNKNVTAKFSVTVVRDKNLSLKASATQLGEGMSGTLTASGKTLKKGTLEYICEPVDESNKSAPADILAINANTATSGYKADNDGAVAVVAKVTVDGVAYYSNAVVITVLPKPASDEIIFSADSISLLGSNQKNMKVLASCAPGTMAELGYKLEGAPATVALNYDAKTKKYKGTLSAGDLSADDGKEFKVVAYDVNDEANTKKEQTIKIVGTKTIKELKTYTVRLTVGETYHVTDDAEDGIIVLADGQEGPGIYSFSRASGTNGVVTWAANGLFTAKKAGTETVKIRSANAVSLKFVVSKANVAKTLSPAFMRLGEGLKGALAPTSSNLVLESTDEEIVTVDKWGNVSVEKNSLTDKTVTRVTITAADPATGEIVDTAVVEAVPAPEGISFPWDDDISIGKKEKITATATIQMPEGVAPIGTVVYEIEDAATYKNYLTVNAKTGLLTAKKATTVSPITVKASIAEYPETSAELEVNIVGSTGVGYVDENTGKKLKSIKLGKGNTYKIGMYEAPDADEEEEPGASEEPKGFGGLHKIVALSPADLKPGETSYKSTNTNIVTVNSSVSEDDAEADVLAEITAVKAGSAKVRVSTMTGRTADLTVQVYDLPKSITLSATSLKLGVGMKRTLKASFPSTKVYDDYLFESSDDEVASVDPTTGEVTAVTPGVAMITVRTANGLTDSCRVEVLPAAEAIDVSIQRWCGEIDYAGEEDPIELTMGVGENSVKIIATPAETEGGEETMSEFDIKYGDNVAAADKSKLTFKTTGELTAKAITGDPIDLVVYDVNDVNNEGTETHVSVTILNKPAKESYKVGKTKKTNNPFVLSQSALLLGVGEEYRIREDEEEGESGLLKFATAPEVDKQYHASFTFKSSNTKVVTVDKQGLVTAVGKGSTKIRIYTQNTGIYRDLAVTVSLKPDSITLPPTLKLGSKMTTTVQPTFAPAGAFEGVDVEVIPAGALTANYNSATGLIELEAGDISAKQTVTLIVTTLNTGLRDTCCVTLLPPPTANEIAIDYDNISAADKDKDGNDIILVSQSEAGVKIVAKCTQPDEAMCDFEYLVAPNIDGLKIDPVTGVLTIGYKEGKVTHTVAVGTYTDAIIATAKNGEPNPAVTAKATLVVVAPPTGLYFHTSDEKPKDTTYALRMGVGETYQIAEYRKNKDTGEETGIIVLDPAGSSASYTYAASASRTKTKSTKVLAVDKTTGLITAKTTGPAYIKVTTQNKLSRLMTVNVQAAPDSITLDPPTQKLGENSNGKVTVIYPGNTYSQASFASSDPDLLEVHADGSFSIHKLDFTQPTNPVVTITATTQNGKTAEAKVEVLTHPTAVSFAQSEYVVSEGMSLATALAEFPADRMAQKFSYASDSSDVATIDPETGVITGVSATVAGTSEEPGKATITVTVNPGMGDGYEQTGEATVIVKPAPTKIEFAEGQPSTLWISTGDTVALPKLVAKDGDDNVVPATFKYELQVPKSDSGDSAYVTIDNDAKTIYGKKERKSDIKINVTAENAPTVAPQVLTVRVFNAAPTGVNLYFDGEKVNDGTIPMFVNVDHPVDAIPLTSEIIVSDPNNSPTSASIKYVSDNPEVATVDANTGVITAKCDSSGKFTSGEATITATVFGGASASVKVTLRELDSSPTLTTANKLVMAESDEKLIEYDTTGMRGMRMKYVLEGEGADKVVKLNVSVENGLQKATIQALSGGTAKIKITGQYGWTEQTIDVQVLYNPDNIALPVRKLYMKQSQEVKITPVLSRNGVSEGEKINNYTKVTCSPQDTVVKVTPTEGADPRTNNEPTAYTINAVTVGNAKVTFTTCNGLEVVCDIEVKESWDKDPSGFGWGQNDDLYIFEGDTAKLEFSLSADVFNATDGAGYTLDASTNAEALTVNAKDGTIKANSVAEDKTKVKLDLKVKDQVLDSVYITVLKVSSDRRPKLYYKSSGRAVTDPAELDLNTDASKGSNRAIRIAKLPATGFNANSVLLGTYEVEIGNPEILEFVGTEDILRSRAQEGTTTVTVTTGGGSVSTTVEVFERHYRALLISEWEGNADLPFVASNISLMEQTLRKSDIDGKNYEITLSHNPTRNQIDEAIRTTFKDTTEKDVSLVYVVAHGNYTSSTGYVFSRSDGSTVSGTNLINWLKNNVKGNIILVVDSCKSGGILVNSALNGMDNIAVITAQVKSKNASYYVDNAKMQNGQTPAGIPKNIKTFEFFTRAFCATLGNTMQVGKDDPWGNKSVDADINGDERLTVGEVFPVAQSETTAMVNKYCYEKSEYYNLNNGGFTARSATKTWAKLKSWWNKGNSEVPQIYTNGLENLEFFGTAS